MLRGSWLAQVAMASLPDSLFSPSHPQPEPCTAAVRALKSFLKACREGGVAGCARHGMGKRVGERTLPCAGCACPAPAARTTYFEAAPLLLDKLADLASGLATSALAGGCQVGPENGVVHVPSAVELDGPGHEAAGNACHATAW